MRGILEEAGRADDYLEIGLDGAWQWNPLDDPLLDTYSLAYSVASLINQLFGKSREPFWQQAYTNLVRWISGTRMARITIRNLLSSNRTARSAFLVMISCLIPQDRNSGRVGLKWRDSKPQNPDHEELLRLPRSCSSTERYGLSHFSP